MFDTGFSYELPDTAQISVWDLWLNEQKKDYPEHVKALVHSMMRRRLATHFDFSCQLVRRVIK